MPYRVGIFERLGKNENFDFELLHGKSEKNSKKKNFQGVVSFKSKQLLSTYIGVHTNNGESSQQILPFLFFSLLRRNPDVILCEGASALINASIAFIYAKIFRKKFIWWSLGQLQGREHSGFRRKIDFWIKYIEKHSDAIYTYSTLGANYFCNSGIPKEKVFVSVNTIDTDKKLEIISNLQIDKPKEFRIAFVGAIIKVKRLETLINVFNELSKCYNDIYLDVIGDGVYMPEIKDYISKNPNDRIIIHGRKGGEELSKLLLQSSVLVLPGLGGLAICDGMIHSLPIICGAADGTELDLIDDSCGFVTSHVTEEFLKEKLLTLIRDRGLAAKLGKNAYKRITEKFSINNYMDNLYRCIDQVTKQQ